MNIYLIGLSNLKKRGQFRCGELLKNATVDLKKFLALSKGSTDNINYTLVYEEKRLVSNLQKQRLTFA